jgi:hypothetical protein
LRIVKTGKVETTTPDWHVAKSGAVRGKLAKAEPAEGATLSDLLTAAMSPNSLVIAIQNARTP